MALTDYQDPQDPHAQLGEPTQYPDEPDQFDATGAENLEGEPVMNEDGSAEVPIGGDAEDGDAQLQQFDVNLAVHLPEHKLSAMAERLFFELDYDITSRKERDERYAKALKEAHLDPSSKDDSGGGQFDGASVVGHPAMIEACIDFAASAIKELYPVSGPVKMHIPGVVTPEVEQRASRKKAFLNWQLNNQVKYRPQLETLLSQLPYQGSQYIKAWFDPAVQRLRLEFVVEEDVILAYGADSLEASARVTHRQRISKYVLRDRVEAGLYRDLDLVGALEPDKSPSQKTVDTVQGRDDPGNNVDQLRTVFELACELQSTEFEDPLVPEGRTAQYLVTLDETSRKILAIYRNWQPDDELLERVMWLVEFPFIPWRGGAIGLYQVIGTLSIAARGALRALLDSAHVNNFPGGLKLGRSGESGQNVMVNPTELASIQGPATVDDIRKLAMPFPFNPPSAVLFQLLGWLTDALKGVVTTAEEKIADASNQMPVGTTLALIEQGAKVFSSIHSRLHEAQHNVLKLVCMINRAHPPIKAAQKAKLEIRPEDFEQNDDVLPVSDPNIFSESQRYAQLQATMQLSSDQRVQYDAYVLHRRALEMLKIPNPDELLPPPKKPQPTNPAAENVQLLSGTPAVAFPDQDHKAHLEVHLRFFADPYLGGSPLMLQKLVPGLVEHVTQHIAFLYGETVNQTLEQALGMPLAQVMQDPQNAKKLDKLCASASILAQKTVDAQLAEVRPVIDHLFQVAESMAQPPMEDPRIMAAKVAERDVARREAKDQADADLAAQKLVADAYNQEANRTSAELQAAAKLNGDAIQWLIDAARTDSANLEGQAHDATQAHLGRQSQEASAHASRIHEALQNTLDRSHQALQADAERASAEKLAKSKPRPTSLH